jgi:flagellar biosynthesis repressor protein FlbT
MFIVEGDMPILKGKEYLPESAAQGPLEQLYYCVQQMYLEESREKYQGRYLQLAAQSMRADPKLSSDLEVADRLITAGDFYRALKALRKIIRTEIFGAGKSSPSANYVPRVNGWKQSR